jgi:hypothetical protein
MLGTTATQNETGPRTAATEDRYVHRERHADTASRWTDSAAAKGASSAGGRPTEFD